MLERLVDEGDALELVGRAEPDRRRAAPRSPAPSRSRRSDAAASLRRHSVTADPESCSRRSERRRAAGRASAPGRAAARRRGAVFFASTSASASVSSTIRPSAIRPSSTAPSLPANVVQTGVPSATASRFIVPPAETTRSASAIRLCASIACSGTTSDGSAASRIASRCAGVRGKDDGLDAGIAAEPLEHVGEERVAVAVVERDLGRRADDDEHAAGSSPSASSTAGSGVKPER